MRPRTPPPDDAAPQTPEQRSPESPPSPLGALGAAAAVGALAPSAAVPGAVPLAVGTVTPLTAAQVVQSSARIVKAFLRFARKRSTYVYPYLNGLVARVYPERTPEEIASLVRTEMRREVEFRNKQKARLRRLLPEALRVADPEQRRQAVQRILERERDYVRMREEAMAARAINAAERFGVKEHSPQGAFWKLSDAVKEHTLDCVAGSAVYGGPEPLGAARRPYAGKLIEIVVTSGEVLPVTPNHPVLTRRGWIAAKDVRVGDDLLRDDGQKRHDVRPPQDDDHVPLVLAEVFDALQVADSSLRVSHRVGPLDFHGDVPGESEVDIAGAYGTLRYGRRVSRFRKPLADEAFFMGDPSLAAPFSSGGVSHESLVAERSSGASHASLLVSVIEPTPLFGGHRAECELHGVGASSSDLDPRIHKAILDRLARDSTLVGQTLEGFSGAVTLDQVIEIRNVEFDGHVFNVETVNGWYTANGFIVANCLMMGNKFWPWKVLDSFHPQLHPGCACELLTLDDAVQRGYMTADQIPDVNDAVIRAKQIMQRFRHLHEYAEPDEVLGYVLEIQETGLAESLVHAQAHGRRLRWAAGTTKGGEFRPRRGGTPGAPTISRRAFRRLRKLLPIMPRTPAQQAQTRDGRWVWMKGVRTFVPEYRAFERMIGGTQFYSPPGSTHVYRDGHLVDTPEDGPTHRDMKRGMAVTKLQPKAAVDPEVAKEKLAQVLAMQKRMVSDRFVSEQLHVSLTSLTPSVKPVVENASGRATHEALLRADFHVVDTHRDGDVTLVNYIHSPTTSRLTVNYKLDEGAGVVKRSEWTPKTPTLDLGAPLAVEPPKNWQEFTADIAAFTGSVARSQNVVPHLTSIVLDPDTHDHNGAHEWDGTMLLGKEVGDAILVAAAKREKGEPLDHAELRNLYDSWQTAIHEGLHAAFPISQDEFMNDPTVAALEEALTEELAHHYTVERLRETGQGDVIAWRNGNFGSARVIGTYQPYRKALDSIFNEAKVAPELRLGHILALKRETDTKKRKQYLAGLLMDEAGTDKPNVVGERVEALLQLAELRYRQGAEVYLKAPITIPDTADAPVLAETMLHGVPIYAGARVSVLSLPKSWGNEGASASRRAFIAEHVTPLPHDGEIVSIHAGSGGTHNFAATVRLDDGRMIYNVLDREVLGLIDPGVAPAPRQAWVAGHLYGDGDLIHYNGISGGEVSEAVIERVHDSSDSGDFVIQARTNENSRKPGQVVLLTPERVGDVFGPGPKPAREVRTPRATVPDEIEGAPDAGPDVGYPRFNPNSDVPALTGLAQVKTRRDRAADGRRLSEVRRAWLDKAQEIRGLPGGGDKATRWTKPVEVERQGVAGQVKPGDRIRYTDPESGTPWRVLVQAVEHDDGVVKLTPRGSGEALTFAPKELLTIIAQEPGTRDALAAMANRSGFQSVSRYETETRKHLEALTKDAQVAVRVRPETLPFLLQEGRLRNAHHGYSVEPGESVRSASYVERREKFERAVWSIDSPAVESPDDFPVYGYLATPGEAVPDSAASAFGEVRVTLKPWVRGRTTFNYSDSMYVTSGGEKPYIAPSPLGAPSALSVSHFQSVIGIERLVHERGDEPVAEPPLTAAERKERERAMWPETWDAERRERLEEQGFRRWLHGDFFEAHVHGGVSIPDDVESVTFVQAPEIEVQEHLNELGIPWGIYPAEPTLHANAPVDDGSGAKPKITKVPDEVTFEPPTHAPDSATMARLASLLDKTQPGEGYVLPGRVWVQRSPDAPLDDNEFVMRSLDGVELTYDAESAAARALAKSHTYRRSEAHPFLVLPGVSAETVHAVWDGFDYNGLRTGVNETTEIAPGLYHSDGYIFGRDNRVVGSFSRIVRGDTVEHAHMALDPDQRGAGFASAFNAHAEERYREMGIREIEVSTTGVGGYAWARAGYVFKPDWYAALGGTTEERAGYEGARRALDYYGESFLRDHAKAAGVPDEVVQEFVDRFPTSEQISTGDGLDRKFRSEFEIAAFGRDYSWDDPERGKMWLGKLVMLDSGWQGVKRLGRAR